MAKPDKALLSLGARGTLGDALTYQERHQRTIVREKPIPTDPQSLPQMYHRWLYKDYILMWNVLTSTQKQVWKSLGARHNRTGLSEFMRDKLLKLEDLEGIWHLDEASGTSLHDSSPNNNTGTAFGTTVVDGIYGKARYFDGLDDRIDCGAHPSIDNIPCCMAFVYPASLDANAWVFGKKFFFDGIRSIFPLTLLIDSLGRPCARIYFGGVFQARDPNPLPATNFWYHLAGTWDGAEIRLLVDGQWKDTKACAVTLPYDPNQRNIGSYDLKNYFHGRIDEVRAYSRIPTDSQILEIAERRLPVQ